MMAVSLSAAIAIVSFALSRAVIEKASAIQPSGNPSDYHYAEENNTFLKPSLGLSIAFLSGLASLCLEVLWTHMFKQVTQNTVYSFSIVLVSFLLALGLGSFVAHILCRIKMRPFTILFALLALSGLLINLSPLAFFRLTNGLEEVFLSSDWQHYNLSVFTIATVVILLPGITVGTILPYLLKTSSARNMGAGKIIGRLISVNTLGAILGSLGAGFFLIPYIGLWQSVKFVAGMYIIMALFVMDRFTIRRLVFRAVSCAGLIFISSLFFSSNHPVVNADSKEEVVLKTWQGSYGTVAVLRKGNDLGIKLNNHYSIGSTAGVLAQELQTQIPLLLHPNPNDVFFIGMGTGITAGAALKFPVQHVEICELIPDIVKASKKYFGPYTNNIFTDSRTSVIIDDGRNYLLGSKKKYDVIIQDFLNPWDAGTGSLYSSEHYRSVQSHLKQGGIFAQWVALFQVSKQEFSIMARTMLDVFPQVTLWRLPSSPNHQLVGLIGYNEKISMNNAQLRRNVESFFSTADHGMPNYYSADEIPYIFYLGNLTLHRAMFENYPINTEDYPLIEYLTPITLQKMRAGIVQPFSGFQFAEFYEKLFETFPPEEDYYLKNLNDKQYRYVYAELYSFKTILYQRAGMSKEAQMNYRRFLFYYPGKYSGIKN
jgi:spermidine synthase